MSSAATLSHRLAALGWGAACHLSFLAAVALMAWELATGMGGGVTPLHGAAALVWDLLLLFAFPAVHSLLLGDRGRRWLQRALGPGLGGILDTTRFALAASVQLGGTFLLWAPLGGELVTLTGELGIVSWAAFGLGWIALGLAMAEAGLGVQTGALGWTAAALGRRPRYPSLPTRGLHQACRHPIYLSFLVILVSGPHWSLDRALLAAVWGAYCLLGPALKERRQRRRHGEAWASAAGQAPWLWSVSEPEAPRASAAGPLAPAHASKKSSRETSLSWI